MFLAAGALAQYVAPQYGIPAALCIAVIGLLLIHDANRKETSLDSYALTTEQYSTLSLPDYSEEWGHFVKINDALIKLQSASLDQVKELLDIIQHERVYLYDPLMNSLLDDITFLTDQWTKLGSAPEGLSPLISKVITGLSNRMHKRYRRS